RPIDLFARLITPIRWAIRIVSEFFITMIVGKELSQGNIVTEDMVRTLVQDAVGKGALDHTEASFIHQIFEFGNKNLEDLMTPRADITFISLDDPLPKILSIMQETRQSRIPVYREHRDTIVGILHVRDLLEVDLDEIKKDQEHFTSLLRAPFFVPESKTALELFDTFRERKLSFAMTVDEYGGVTGLVTMEDLMECIFGDIHSPSDITEQFEAQQIEDGNYLLDGSMQLDDFDQKFGTQLQREGVETVGGLVLNTIGELPAEGDVVVIERFKYTISKISKNRIAQLQLESMPENTTPAEEELESLETPEVQDPKTDSTE
ncbi:MAG: HlyC/CorC family transporter, partial [Gammaproteobacteria bacterium]|nr:HlyC/CorC family transporter [Gammaproteobacteria bacterium]